MDGTAFPVKMDFNALVDEAKQLEADLEECSAQSRIIEEFVGDLDLPPSLKSRLSSLKEKIVVKTHKRDQALIKLRNMYDILQPLVNSVVVVPSPEVPIPVVCCECKTPFDSNDLLEEHMRNCHPSECNKESVTTSKRTASACPECGATFKYPRSLQKHIRRCRRTNNCNK